MASHCKERSVRSRKLKALVRPVDGVDETIPSAPYGQREHVQTMAGPAGPCMTIRDPFCPKPKHSNASLEEVRDTDCRTRLGAAIKDVRDPLTRDPLTRRATGDIYNAKSVCMAACTLWETDSKLRASLARISSSTQAECHLDDFIAETQLHV